MLCSLQNCPIGTGDRGSREREEVDAVFKRPVPGLRPSPPPGVSPMFSPPPVALRLETRSERIRTRQDETREERRGEKNIHQSGMLLGRPVLGARVYAKNRISSSQHPLPVWCVDGQKKRMFDGVKVNNTTQV